MSEPRGTYMTRVNKNGQYIDIVHADAGPGAGCIARIPIRSRRRQR